MPLVARYGMSNAMRFVGLVGAAFALLACALVALSLRLARRSREA